MPDCRSAGSTWMGPLPRAATARTTTSSSSRRFPGQSCCSSRRAESSSKPGNLRRRAGPARCCSQVRSDRPYAPLSWQLNLLRLGWDAHSDLHAFRETLAVPAAPARRRYGCLARASALLGALLRLPPGSSPRIRGRRPGSDPADRRTTCRRLRVPNAKGLRHPIWKAERSPLRTTLEQVPSVHDQKWPFSPRRRGMQRACDRLGTGIGGREQQHRTIARSRRLDLMTEPHNGVTRAAQHPVQAAQRVRLFGLGDG